MRKVLVVTNRVPYPLTDGGNMAVYNALELYLDLGYEVHLVSMNTSRHYVHQESLPLLFRRLSSLTLHNVNNEITWTGALKALLKNESYHLSRFTDQPFSQKVISLLKTYDFDLVQLEGLYVSMYYDELRQHTPAKIIYRQHNIEFRIWEKKAEQEKNLLKKVYYGILSRQLRTYECGFIKKAGIICPISLNDYRFNEAQNPAVIQFYWPYTPRTLASIEAAPFEQRHLRLYHIGAMDWVPNQEAVDWLLNDIFPALEKENPQAELYIAGRNMPERYYSYCKQNVHVLGEVEDSYDFQKDKNILLIPLKSASGQRIKFIEAMHYKKCIVSTEVGKSDISADDGIHYLRADNTSAFIAQIMKLSRDPELYYSICRNAQERFEEAYSFDSQKIKINSFINKICASSY